MKRLQFHEKQKNVLQIHKKHGTKLNKMEIGCIHRGVGLDLCLLCG